MPEQQFDERKVRIGLTMVAVAVVVAIVAFVLVGSALGRAIIAVVLVLGLVRAFLLYRSLRREHAPEA